ncbi:DUF4865 family protein [Vagococcus hydrophili]|uniref:DUF4865 family protein n=1 Tax=Vagococcus hydrophili TaxID=2714947 RepID=A0A6G8AR05_9ENTE|nr:DUF4865 family protein [Vagococcus hydrophili]QIL47372.1 DUF4865 family protein [Vagococcus hydrophili]
MNVMQYKIKLPKEYGMEKIRERVANNGVKTDGFLDLLMKVYLIREESKEYAPLYLWKSEKGMNHFIFDGYYDNILSSFGWRQINIAIPLIVEVNQKVKASHWVLEIEKDIKEVTKMKAPEFSITPKDALGKLLVYNPDKWKQVEFYFFKEKSKELECFGSFYEVLHIST